jgi:hypothetical protein
MNGIRNVWPAVICAVVIAAPVAAADAIAIDPLVAAARRAGLRVLESERLVLVTDRPPREGDGVEQLPAVFDAAFAAWCRHYDIDPASLPDWRALGCLVVDRERFRAAGLLPDTIPEFANGFCDRNHFWLADQSNPAYRRHLLLHEGVHAFTLTARSLATPVWYNEGIAEYLATHRLDRDGDTMRFVATPVPDRADDVEQLGRIETLRELRATGKAPALADVLAAPVGVHHAIADYASSWAAVVLFARHPAYAPNFATIERGPLGPDVGARLAAMPGYDAARAARDFDAFTADVDYGYDFNRSAIDWSPGRPLAAPARVTVAADRGWQNTGLALARGEAVTLAATGRCSLGTSGTTPLETEADGISLDWYRGRPLGRLLAAQWVEAPSDDGRPRFVVFGEGRAATLTAAADGPLYLMLNGPPGTLARRAGSLTVELAPRR